MPDIQYILGELFYLDSIARFLFVHISTFLFFLALLLNFGRTSVSNSNCLSKEQTHEPLILSLVMFFSYSITIPLDYSNLFVEIRSVYLPNTLYLALDLLTIVFIHRFVKPKSEIGQLCRLYIFVALSINSLLFFLLQLDFLLSFYKLKNNEYWWFWSFFSYGINTFDLIMVLVLVIQKDFLGWYKLAEKIKGAVSRP
jgi:hypothetical protein